MIINLTNRFILILDVETANDTEDAFTYDIGYQIIDLFGVVHAEGSFVIRDIFFYEKELMNSAYYSNKIPEYLTDIREGKREVVNFMYARRKILNLMKEYNCNTVAAYNAHFDRNALNKTVRFITKSKVRYFFPYGTEFICIWNMACNSICQTSDYKTFAETNFLYSNHGKNYRATAETVYAFLTNNSNFQEEHKGLDDVKIEKEIFVKCLEHGSEIMGIKRNCWTKVKRGALTLR